MTKHILVIQFREDQSVIAQEQAWYRTLVGERACITFHSALDVTRVWHTPAEVLRGFDGVILGGSGEYFLDGGAHPDALVRQTARTLFERMGTFVAHMLEHEVPLLGVCFGHQIIADAYGGMVSHDEAQKKAGSFDVVLTADGLTDRLFSALPDTFVAQYGHKDSVTSLPQGAVLLAQGPACRFSALRYGRHAYTVQFHPELDVGGILSRIQNTIGYLPAGVEPCSVVRPSPHASRIVPLFVERIVRA